MLWTIAIILVVLWALGLVSSYTLGGFIHILLVLAIIALVVGLLQRRRVAWIGKDQEVLGKRVGEASQHEHPCR